jgi:hypothetical protein
MKLTKKSLIALILSGVVLLGLGGATLAFAAPTVFGGRGPGWPWGPDQGGRGGAVGTVKSIDATQLVVTEADSKVITATITSQTQVYLMPGRTAGKVTDIKVGDTVQVKGRPNTSGVLEAQAITVGPLEQHVGGQVTAVDGLKITVQISPTAQSTQTTQVIVTDANTKFFAAGKQAATLADVKTGDYVTALVTKQTDGSLLASQVMIGLPGGFGRGHGGMGDRGDMMGQPWTDENRVGGQVTAVDGLKITVQISPTAQSTQTTQIIVTDANTKFFAAGKQAATLADVKTGEYVMALVTKQTDGSLLATQVMVGVPGGFGRGGRGGMMGQPWTDENRMGGQVTAVDGPKITIQVGQSTQAIVTDGNTKFFAAGKQTATLADVKTGEYVMAQVTKQADGSWLATQVMVGNQPGLVGPGRRANPNQRQWPGVQPTPLAPGTQS